MQKLKTDKRFLIIVSLIALSCVIFATAFFALSAGKNSYERQLSLGEKYLYEMQYENAVVAFNKAIEIDPMQPKAYILLADTYLALGDTDNAISTLQKGFDKTGDNEIKTKLDELLQKKQEAEQPKEPEVVLPMVDEFFATMFELAKTEKYDELWKHSYDSVDVKIKEFAPSPLKNSEDQDVFSYSLNDGNYEYNFISTDLGYNFVEAYRYTLSGDTRTGEVIKITANVGSATPSMVVINAEMQDGVYNGNFVQRRMFVFEGNIAEVERTITGTAVDGVCHGKVILNYTDFLTHEFNLENGKFLPAPQDDGAADRVVVGYAKTEEAGTDYYYALPRAEVDAGGVTPEFPF